MKKRMLAPVPIWQKLSVTVMAEQVDVISDQLSEWGASAVTFLPAEAQAEILEPDPETNPLWSQVEIEALFPVEWDLTDYTLELQRQFALSLEGITINALQEEPWTQTWEKYFEPIAISPRLWVCPKPEDVVDRSAINILLPPGLAFGTGTHPTTALCLKWLDGHIAGDESVIDFGCGSGILTVAALKLGAASVVAIDHDPQALIATSANLQGNLLGMTSCLLMKTAESLSDAAYDVIVANILANPLIEMAPLMLSLLKPGGRLALSGILASQRSVVEAAYADHIAWEPVVTQEEWVLLSGVKKAT